MTGEKTKGRKRHIVTDIMGNLFAVHVHAANIHDTKGGVYTFEKALYHYPSIEAGCADEGYRGTFKNTFEIFHNIRIDISKQIKPVFEVMTKRWRVERPFHGLVIRDVFLKIMKSCPFPHLILRYLRVPML